MKAKSQGQLRTENKLLKQKNAELENKIKEAHRTSPEGQLIEELQELKASRQQLAENCQYYRDQKSERQGRVDELEELVYQKDEAIKERDSHLQDLRVALDNEVRRSEKYRRLYDGAEWAVAALKVKLGDENTKFNVLAGCYALTLLAMIGFEAYRFFGG